MKKNGSVELNRKILTTGIYFSSKGSSSLMDKVSASQPWDRGFELYTGHDHDFSYDTSTG